VLLGPGDGAFHIAHHSKYVYCGSQRVGNVDDHMTLPREMLEKATGTEILVGIVPAAAMKEDNSQTGGLD
jgi:hypothetical protein